MPYTARFESALVFAARLHAEQVRKGPGRVPYVGHLLGVASIAIEHGATENEAIAALLHDAIEDQGGRATEAVILRTFGQAVADIVRGCTDADTEPKPPWEQRKRDYLEHLKHATPSVRLVSASDKLYNARSVLNDYRKVGEELWKRFSGGREGTLWYYQTLLEIFRAVGPTDLAEELGRVVEEIDRLAARKGA